MAKKSKKTSKTSTPSNTFSAAFTRAIAACVREHCSDGSCMPRSEIAEQLLATGAVTEDHPELLTVMVGEAVKLGEVPGCSSRRGPGGGVFYVSAYEKANAAE